MDVQDTHRECGVSLRLLPDLLSSDFDGISGQLLLFADLYFPFLSNLQ